MDISRLVELLETSSFLLSIILVGVSCYIAYEKEKILAKLEEERNEQIKKISRQLSEQIAKISSEKISADENEYLKKLDKLLQEKENFSRELEKLDEEKEKLYDSIVNEIKLKNTDEKINELIIKIKKDKRKISLEKRKINKKLDEYQELNVRVGENFKFLLDKEIVDKIWYHTFIKFNL